MKAESANRHGGGPALVSQRGYGTKTATIGHKLLVIKLESALLYSDVFPFPVVIAWTLFPLDYNRATEHGA
jgi:hypothetical protein